MKKIKSTERLEKYRKELLAKRDAHRQQVIVFGGTCGRSRGSEDILSAVRSELKNQGLEEKVEVKLHGAATGDAAK